MAGTKKLVFLGAVAAALLVAAPISAISERVGTGTGTLEVRSSTIVRQADDYRIEKRTIRGTLSGALKGSYVERVRGVVRASGRVTFRGTMTFTGTVAGCGSGTFKAGLSGQGQAGQAPITNATVLVIDGGALELHGSGTVHQEGAVLSYKIRYECL
jgi:hypothetical protein